MARYQGFAIRKSLGRVAQDLMGGVSGEIERTPFGITFHRSDSITPLNNHEARTGLPAGRTPAAAFARRHRTGFIHHHCSAHQILAVARVHRALRRRVVADLDKTKTASLPRETVTHDGYRIDRHAIIAKEVLHIRFVRRVREVSYKELLHLTLLTVTGDR